jgi:hypothetical protein
MSGNARASSGFNPFQGLTRFEAAWSSVAVRCSVLCFNPFQGLTRFEARSVLWKSSTASMFQSLPGLNAL